MSQPPGFVDPMHPHHVCHLRHSLYGLKEAPRAWFLHLSLYLLSLDFIGSVAHTSLFIQHILAYVMFLLVSDLEIFNLRK